MKCEICQYEYNTIKVLSIHLSKKHNYNKDMMKIYYDKYFKKDGEGKCYFCNNDSVFKNMSNGYHRICSSKECLGKTRATGTYQFLMYKYNLNEEDAIKMMNERALERGEKIKNGLNKKYNENNNFFKEKSNHCKEYWIKRGYSENDAILKSKEKISQGNKKVWEKRRNNPESYQDVNTTQIGYWLKKGYNEEESKLKISERQKTFSLDICIKKHGEEKGSKIFKERQIKWSEKIEKKYKNGEFTKFTKNMYSPDELELMNNICAVLNINAHYGKDQFFRYFKKLGKTFSYDFVYNKKIIEFNGDYWHCNPKIYNSNYFHKYLQMFAYEIWENEKIKINAIKEIGYDVLIIWESNYKQNKEKSIQECIDFIKK